MTSKRVNLTSPIRSPKTPHEDKRSIGKIIKDFDEQRPKTPHEEIMFCIESTNDIVSKILDILNRLTLDVKTIRRDKITLGELARRHGLTGLTAG